MLKLLNSENLDIVLKKAENSVLGTRIACYALCYGFDKDFIDFWAGDNSLICRFDYAFTVIADRDADFSEIREFINIIGAKNITTTEEVAASLDFAEFGLKTAFIYKGENDISDCVTDISEAYLKESYKLISKSIPDSFKSDKESYLSFLSDFYYRKNRGYARGKCILDGGNIVSTAFTSAEAHNSAIISGVACEEGYRKFGYGKEIVLTLAQTLKNENKAAYVIALNDSAKGFYKHIGFEEIDKIAYITEKV